MHTLSSCSIVPVLFIAVPTNTQITIFFLCALVVCLLIKIIVYETQILILTFKKYFLNKPKQLHVAIKKEVLYTTLTLQIKGNHRVIYHI